MTTRLWLKEIREGKKLTQEDVAKRGGFARTYYTMVETGKRTPSVKMAKEISLALDFEWTKFFE